MCLQKELNARIWSSLNKYAEASFERALTNGLKEAPSKPPIVEYTVFDKSILVCKKCGNPVNAGYDKYYGCDTCDAWVTSVEWKKQPFYL